MIKTKYLTSMKKSIFYNFIFRLSIFILLFSVNSYAGVVINKKGSVIEEIKSPTAESTIDPDTSSDALRKIVDGAKDYSKSSYSGPTKNVYSSNTIGTNNASEHAEFMLSLYNEKQFDIIEKYGELKVIRHTSSITNVEENKYRLSTDSATGRLKMMIVGDDVQEIEAKDGYYRINGKTYYFDENGLMVLGPATDKSGNYYFFSYDTGELIQD